MTMATANHPAAAPSMSAWDLNHGLLRSLRLHRAQRLLPLLVASAVLAGCGDEGASANNTSSTTADQPLLGGTTTTTTTPTTVTNSNDVAAAGSDPARDPTVVAALAALPVAPASTSGSAVTCTNQALSARQVTDVRVDAGSSCRLDAGVIVTGSITLGSGAVLQAGTARINGSITGANAGTVFLDGTSVDNSVTLGVSAQASIRNSTIQGSLTVENSTGSVVVRTNTVNNDVTLRRNSGSVAVVGNSIQGDLDCTLNGQLPTGSGNIVTGSKAGQCSAL